MNNKINELELEIKKLEELSKKSPESVDTINIKISRLKTLLYHELTSPRTPDLSDGVIDLYKSDNEHEADYTIYLSNTEIYIGFIDYRFSKIANIGDIGYGILPKYRGNHYALRALNLICDSIIKRGINEVTICAKCDNIASIKTIQKFGGKLINKKDDILYFKCNIKEKGNNKVR